MIDDEKIKIIFNNVCVVVKSLEDNFNIKEFINAYMKKFPECEKEEYIHAGIIFMNMMLTIPSNYIGYAKNVITE